MDQDLIGGFRLGALAGSFHDLAVDERCPGTDQSHEVRRVNAPPAGYSSISVLNLGISLVLAPASAWARHRAMSTIEGDGQIAVAVAGIISVPLAAN